MQHGLITKIAKVAGFPVQTVWNYCKGNYSPKLKRAELLEKVTGVDRLIWLEGDAGKIQAALEASPLVNG